MRPRTKIALEPDPKKTEFQNFDRLVRVLMTKPPIRKAAKPPGKAQDAARLPRP